MKNNNIDETNKKVCLDCSGSGMAVVGNDVVDCPTCHGDGIVYIDENGRLY